MGIHGSWLAISWALLTQAPGADVPPATPKAEAPKAEASKKAEKQDGKTPEEALRAFLIAMVDQDEARLKALAVPNPDLAILLKPSGPPLNAMQKALARTTFARSRIRVLKTGDVVEIPGRKGKRPILVGPEDVSKNAAFLQMEGNPLPTRLRKIEGAWRVDAAPIIAGRKAAEAARKKQEERKAQESQKEQPKP